MPPASIHHPIQAAIDQIWNAGHTPRIQVDARRDDVVVPESVKERWGARLVLDLDASWPLNLEYDETGIAVDLAFQGQVTRCTLPWSSIYVVLDRSTGGGVLIESHVPPDQLEEDEDAEERERAAAKRRSEHPTSLGRPTPLRPSAKPPEAPSEPAGPQPGEESSTESAPTRASGEIAPTASEEEAKRRRAKFKVIDGGG